MESKGPGGVEAVVVVEPGRSTYRAATADEIRDGHYFESFEAYQRAQIGEPERRAA